MTFLFIIIVLAGIGKMLRSAGGSSGFSPAAGFRGGVLMSMLRRSFRG